MQELINVRESYNKKMFDEKEQNEGNKKIGMLMMFGAPGSHINNIANM